MLIITSPNIGQAIALLEAGEAAAPKATTAARKAVAELAFQRDLEFLQEIYDQPDTEDFIGGDYVGPYLSGGLHVRSGALKAAETLLTNAKESIITTKAGLVVGTAGAKSPENYAEIRAHKSRPAGSYWRERAAEAAEEEGMEKGEIAFVEAMPAGLVTR